MRPFWHPRQLECCLSQVAGSNLYHLFLCYFWSIIWENIWVFWNRSDLEVFVTFFDFNGNFNGKMAKIWASEVSLKRTLSHMVQWPNGHTWPYLVIYGHLAIKAKRDKVNHQKYIQTRYVQSGEKKCANQLLVWKFDKSVLIIIGRWNLQPALPRCAPRAFVNFYSEGLFWQGGVGLVSLI